MLVSSESVKRMLIITTATAEVNAKAHYLTGADGGMPGGSSGLSRTPRLLEDLTIEKLGVHAAESDFGVCRGRCNAQDAGRQTVYEGPI